jgi:hypothetical protein
MLNVATQEKTKVFQSKKPAWMRLGGHSLVRSQIFRTFKSILASAASSRFSEANFPWHKKRVKKTTKATNINSGDHLIFRLFGDIFILFLMSVFAMFATIFHFINHHGSRLGLPRTQTTNYSLSISIHFLSPK